MTKRNYWEDRFNRLQEAQLMKGQTYYYEVEEQYIKASAEIEKEIAVWYQRFASNNEISLVEAKRLLNSKELKEFKWDVTDYIKYGEENELNQRWMKELENASARVHISRLEALKIQTQHQIEVLYGNQVDGIDRLVRDIYSEGYYHTAYEIQRGFNVGYDLHSFDSKQLEQVISKPWTADGLTFKDRCWTSKQQLVNSVHTELTQAIIRGDSPSKAINAIAKEFNVSKNRAARLIMTESAFFASVAQKDCFNELNVEKYEIVATLDSNTSKVCQGLDGQIFAMQDYQVSVTAPPFHAWCRTVFVPYFDDDFEGERAATDKDGKTYYVPRTMKYEDWKNSFVNGGSKDGLKEVDPNKVFKDKETEIQALKKSIMDKHDAILKADIHKVELEQILSNHGSEQLNLYDKLSDRFKDNDYYYKVSGAAYYPGQQVIKMNIENNQWERLVGSNYTGAWHTKFHEEFHQLDHILSQTPFAYLDDGTISPYKNMHKAFTRTDTVIGARMINAIDDDVLLTVNNAIKWYNKIEGLSIKPLKNLDRISSEAYTATIRYLKTTYNTQKARTQISMFTDAMGLTTKNRLNPHGNGFWGHDAAYNKDRGKDGATSETWATFGALFYTADDETLSVIKTLMPNTWKTYSSVMNDLLDYAIQNDITYS
ncbi:minor capsid protein [Paenibacillus lentus]|uniref:Phage head morphogenesis domain-containing protein n=1 Tax=Paenibacillus lentus TaxID=1338368 RepID=A0A3S8RP80_9BACL|nr:minor capsid protein [Paenibacillus lentus]AZK44784.1 hypothetical protein EIM92_00050 [Paenibacillus lentus]